MANIQNININFQQGINTKTDPWQVPIGQFLSLVNMVFQTTLLLKKRNGYGELSGVPPMSSYLTTLNDNLLAVGSTINAYSASTETWITKGTLQPCSLSVLPLVRNNVNQTQADAATANGLVCTAYTENYGTSSANVTSYFYSIEDMETGQNIVGPTAIPVLSAGAISGSSRVFVVGNFFVIVSPVLISGTTYLQYVSIPLIQPTLISAAQNTFPEAYVPLSGNPGWDGVVTIDTLVLAYNTTAGAQGIHITSLTAGQIAANSDSGVVHAFANSVYKAGILSACVDLTVSPHIVYVSFWNPSTSNGYTCAVYISFGAITTVFTPQLIISTVAVVNLASSAQNGSALVYSEVTHPYSYDSAIPSNFVDAITVSQAGSVGTAYVVIRSVGLASKAFIIEGVSYVLSAFQSPFQPSYFLINGSTSTSASPVIVAKLAYQNGGGYLSLGLPSVSTSGSQAQIAYLYKQDVEALNTLNNTQQTTAGGIYSQLGVNLVSFELGTENIVSSEIGQDLHLSGGYLSMFDGFAPVEHNFFVFPDSVECTFTANSVKTPTGTWTLGSTSITLSSATGVFPGMSITDSSNAYIPAGTTILYVNGTTITISQPTTHAASGDTLSIQGNIVAQPDGSTNTDAYFYQVTYEWTDMQGNAFRSQPSIAVAVTTTGSASTSIITVNVPMLRLTQKITHPVKIVIYRWSLSTQVYNQVTSIFAPILNNTTLDSYTYVDTIPDANVIGNNLLYTTGGVVPDTNAPSCNIMTLFDTRLCLVNAEDPNVLWVSKTVIENTPVEMSSLFTIYVAPNIGTTGSSGPMTAVFPMDDKLLLFKKNVIYYINGTGPDNLGTTSPGCSLGNYSQPIFVTSVVGSTNQQSLVLTPGGVMFQSDKGIWIVRRDLQTDYIGAPVERFNASTVTSAQVIPDTNYVVFTLNTGEILMYDYYVGQWGIFKGAQAISSCIYNGLHTLLTPQGLILQETPGQFLDGSNPVLMTLVSSWINLASLQGYQRFYEMTLLANYLSPHKILVGVAYDYNPSLYHQSTLQPQNFSPSAPSPFGVPTPVGSLFSREQWRIHAKQQLCQSFQITLQEVFDPTLGTLAGAGFTLSGFNCKIGVKKATRPIPASNAVG